nr:hypothetical protein CKG001_27180 [Bdellovibrio sp. CKG001]BFD64025.1 hypothetical protein BdHM001_27060 [Bdellovibrio sp. HM001]BFD68215.1 hypothetical protein HAGR004_32370 [Bdellovibrio sp. HAGR004]
MKKFLMALALVFAPALALADVTVQPLTVEAKAQDQYLNYNFGTSFVHSARFQDFTLTANGPDSTFIRGLGIHGSFAYRVDTNCPQILMPGQRCTIRVIFHPTVEGSHWGDVTIYLRDSNIYIRLYGNAIR